jgi:poly-gamma-glutamate synthesis protein (capsule biosynthesis protein)
MKLKIYAVGDIMLGEQHLCNNFGVKDIIRKNGADFLFEGVSSLFKDADIVFGNLECSIMDVNHGNKPAFFCAEPDAVSGLKNAHFNVLSVANNHIMEHGRKSFLHTVQILNNNGIAPVGIRGKIDVLDVKGCKIAFLAYSFIEDHIADVCYNKIHSEKAIVEDIQKVRSLSDFVIVSLHWGCEYVPYPSPDQIRIGRDLVDAGADIILGGHPHVTQSYEVYRNRPIFYSLGNFIFDDTYIPTTRESFIAEIIIDDSPNSMNVNILPVMINEDNYQPRPAPHLQADSIASVEKVRDILENRSLSDYENAIGDYDLLYSKYKETAKWNMKVQFLKNFYRYSPSTTFGMIKEYFNK